MNPKLREQFERLGLRLSELDANLSDPQVLADIKRYRSLSREQSEVAQVMQQFRQYEQRERDLQAGREMLADPEMAGLADEEITAASADLQRLHGELQAALLPRDPDDDRNAFLEIRAGTGGDEATLFAGEVFRMYTRYAEERRWKVEITDLSESAVGGVKEVIALISGDKVFSKLKYESGVHRVQRVPETETQGRVHTSAITVAVLPEADDVEIDIQEKDIRVDTFCSSGPGGQSVNTT
jgi:peptide chain release factor 1